MVQVVHMKSAVFVLSQSGLARENRRRPFNCPNMGSQMLLCVDHCKFAQPLPPCQRPHHLASAWSTTQLFSCEPFYPRPALVSAFKFSVVVKAVEQQNGKKANGSVRYVGSKIVRSWPCISANLSDCFSALTLVGRRFVLSMDQY